MFLPRFAYFRALLALPAVLFFGPRAGVAPKFNHVTKSDSLHYGLGTWEPDSLGNHRAVVRVDRAADAVLAHIPWRRRDQTPEKVNLVVINATTNQRVRNVIRQNINREFGDIAFEVTTAGDYYVYYLPYTGTFKSNYPKITYRVVEQTADSTWLTRNGLGFAAGGNFPAGLAANRIRPTATTTGFDAVNEFSKFTQMEYIAGAAELATLRESNRGSPFLAFAEDRANSIRMRDDIPHVWAERGAFKPFTGTALRGESYAFQIGVWAYNGAINLTRTSSRGLKRVGGSETIPASAIKSLNFGGTDWSGTRFTRSVHVDSGKVQALWYYIDVPATTAPGDYEGQVALEAKAFEPRIVKLTLHVSPALAKNHGDDAPANLTRLRWLNSQLAADDEIVAPYIPLTLTGRTISLLGRSFTFGSDGMPTSIRSFFSSGNTEITTKSREILERPIALNVIGTDGRVILFSGAAPVIVKQTAGKVAWTTTTTAGALTKQLRATLEFEGTAEYTVAITARKRTEVQDVRFELPLNSAAAKYMMGLGQKGGYRPENFHWTWDVAKRNQDAAWIGDVNAGVQFTLKDEHYVRPLNTNFYLSKPLIAPKSWANAGKGGCDIVSDSTTAHTTTKTVTVSCYSSPHVIEAGDSLRFDFRLMVTPFKPLDTKGQWSTRYFHAFVPVDSAQKRGANTINVHHANRVNPWINYPFIETAAMRSYVDSAHARGMKAKIYYTVRELTDRAPEIFALRSLGDEVLSSGPGGGFSWLQEHLGGDYIAAWHVPENKDAAIVNSGGYASSANLYLEHFPFINRLWFGEYFDYDSRADYWLVEISGIPFGLMGEMLEKGGNPWRGMTMGMTARLPWSGDPSPLWKVWDEFGIQRSRMYGWWSGVDPVTTSDPEVLATTWVIPGKGAMISLASWKDTDAEVDLKIDWARLGIPATAAQLRLPGIPDFQEPATLQPNTRLTIPVGRGRIVLISRE